MQGIQVRVDTAGALSMSIIQLAEDVGNGQRVRYMYDLHHAEQVGRLSAVGEHLLAECMIAGFDGRIALVQGFCHSCAHLVLAVDLMCNNTGGDVQQVAGDDVHTETPFL